MRVRLLGAAVALCGLGGGGATLLTGSASADSGPSTQRVIVVFHNQDAAQPATPKLLAQRRASFHATQAPIVSQLQSGGASNIQQYAVVDAVSATVSSSEVSALNSDPAVSEVVPDRLIRMATPSRVGSAAAAAGASATCSAGKPELNPQALETISADSDQAGAKTARSLGMTGAGVKVAFIADGLDTNDPDFIRADGQPVFTDYKDFSGNGTGTPTGGAEAFIDSSAIAAQGRETYNVTPYSGAPLSGPCNIRIEGVAPGASLIGLDVFGPNAFVFDSTFLEAINYAVSDGANVLNESLGSNVYPDDQGPLDVIKQANDAAVAAGLTVTVSAGDAGVTSTIGTPATDPDVIDVGASTTFRGYAETNFQGFDTPGVTGWLNDNISGLSSGGFQQDGSTVDLVAPGDLNWALCSTDVTIYQDCFSFAGNPTSVQLQGGTSQAAPLTAGTAALVIQAYRESHGGVSPTPAQVKQLIVSNTDDIGSPADQQGAGRLDAYKAVLGALNDNPSTRLLRRYASVATVADGATSLHAADLPGTAETLSDTITNMSARAKTFWLATRAIGSYTSVRSTTVTLADSNPQLVDETGTSNNLQRVSFYVPRGENRLNVSLAFPAPATQAFYQIPQLTLIDPHGNYAAYDIPEGNAEYGNSQVTDPAPGVWTALVYAPDSSDGGYTGNIAFAAQVAQDTTFGTVSPAVVRLAPGQSSPVTLHVSTPAQPGDDAGAIIVGSAGPGQDGSDSTGDQVAPAPVTTIPVTLRSLIPSGNASFTSETTGGNGRAYLNGQTFYYQLNVSAGSPELNARVTLDTTPGQPVQAWLVDPSGSSEAFANNVEQANAFSSSPGTVTQEPGVQLHVLSPAAGDWTLIVEFGPTASGTQITAPFTVSTDQTAVPVGSGGLPAAASTALTAGEKYTYDVTVHNTGTAPELFFPDARLSGTTELNLDPIDGADTVAPLPDSGNEPGYLVPTETSSVTGQASTTGSTPIAFDIAPEAINDPELGDPDIGSTSGLSAVATWSANVVTSGAWGLTPDVVGTFGATGPATEPVTTSLTAITSPFDPTVSSPTGDLEADSTNTSALSSFSPVTVPAGQTGTIPVTIAPSGKSGTTVSGTLYLDDYSDMVFNTYLDPVGDQVASIPYTYTIK